MSYRKDRDVEHAFFRSGKLPADVIHTVTVTLDSDGDFIIYFENGWKECHALRNTMRIAERGTAMSMTSFPSFLNKMKEIYGRVDGPVLHDGRLTGIIYPPKGELHSHIDCSIMGLGLSFDPDGDLLFTATTKDDHVYTVRLETYPRNASFTKLDCDALMQILQFLEPGEEVTPSAFLAFGLRLREIFNFVRPFQSDDGRKVSITILPSESESGLKLHPLFIDELHRLKADIDATPAPASSNLSCPYPGISYTKLLKEGDRTQVYTGKTANGQDVAIKVFSTFEGDEKATAAYKTELRMLLKILPHPNVVEVLDYFETPRLALVMRLVDGENLMDYLADHGRCGEIDGRQLVVGIGKGLRYLHQHGITHHRLNTLDILRQRDGSAVIAGLGPGSDVKKGTSSSSISVEQISSAMAAAQIAPQTSAAPTPWIPRETLTDQTWSEKGDVYSFGVIMWHIFSGQPSMDKRQGLDTVLGSVTGDHPPLSAVSHLPGDLISLMQECWNPESTRRPSMNRVMDILDGNDPRLIFSSIDHDKNGALDFGEFVAFLQRYVPGRVEPGRMHTLFQGIDKDNSGRISFEEFENFWVHIEKGGLQFAMKIGLAKKIANLGTQSGDGDG